MRTRGFQPVAKARRQTRSRRASGTGVMNVRNPSMGFTGFNLFFAISSLNCSFSACSVKSSVQTCSGSPQKTHFFDVFDLKSIF
jgi:hypothetical protein